MHIVIFLLFTGLPAPKSAIDSIIEETDVIEEEFKPKASQVADIEKPKKNRQPVKITIPALPVQVAHLLTTCINYSIKQFSISFGLRVCLFFHLFCKQNNIQAISLQIQCTCQQVLVQKQ